MTDQKDEYTLALALGSIYVASRLAVGEGDSDRQKKMLRVIKEKIEVVRGAWPEETKAVDGGTTAGSALRALELDHDTRYTLLIDLVFSDPFAPYELKYSERALKTALEDLASRLDLPPGTVDEIGKIRKQASNAHRKHGVAIMAAFGLGGAALLAVGGWMAAPAVAAYLGASAGLAGAAATLHGLALIGGGTLAAGGYGAAGGMAVITGAGAMAGGLGGTGGAFLYQLGAKGAQSELVKLQVTFKAVLLNNQAQTKKAQEVVKGLAARERELGKTIKEQRMVNEDNARKIKDLTTILESVQHARRWIDEQKAAS